MVQGFILEFSSYCFDRHKHIILALSPHQEATILPPFFPLSHTYNFLSVPVWGLTAGGESLDDKPCSFPLRHTGSSQPVQQSVYINLNSLHDSRGWINAASCPLGFRHPTVCVRSFWCWRSVSIRVFLTLQQFARMIIYTLVCLGSTKGASDCFNSQLATGELLRGAAEFTLGGQGPLLFAWVQCEHLGHPPTRIHRTQYISDSAESSCYTKLPFCQTHNT